MRKHKKKKTCLTFINKTIEIQKKKKSIKTHKKETYIEET